DAKRDPGRATSSILRRKENLAGGHMNRHLWHSRNGIAETKSNKYDPSVDL
ncbi:MAG: hypothetical protein ACI9MR_002406, partial [Myxococcota bacterium]